MQALATVALMASLLGAGPPEDPALARARAHVEEARKAFTKRQFAVALREFEAAQVLKPAPVLWYNIGKCHEKLNDVPRALRAYRLYLSEAPGTPDRKELSKAITRMEKRLRARGVQQLLVLAQPAGGTASIPGKGSRPVPASFELRPGRYTVTVTLNGHQPDQRQVTMTPRRSALVEVMLRPVETAPPPMPPPVAALAGTTSPGRASTPGGAAPAGDDDSSGGEESPTPLVQPAAPAETAGNPVAVAARPTPPASPASPPADRPVAQPAPPAVMGPLVPEPRTPLALGPPPPPRGRAWTWIAGGATLVGAGVGVGFGLSANAARDELLGAMHSEAEANAIYGRARSSALYSNIGYGAAAAAGLAAVILFLVEAPPSGALAMGSSSGGAPVVLSF